MEVEHQGTSPPLETVCRAQPLEDGSDDNRLREVIDCGLLGFDDWTSLISDIEDMFPEDIERLSLVYDSFLSKFPLCHVYWRKYANHQKRLSGTDKAVQVFEQAVLAVTYSVGLWVDYCQFASSVFEDPDDVRRLFKRAILFVGKDYSCHSLWDKYIEFEFSQHCWSSLACIFIQTLRFPTKKLHHYYKSLEKLVAIWEEEMKSQNSAEEPKLEVDLNNELQASNNDKEICEVIRKLLDSSDGQTRSRELQKYKAIGEQLYKSSCLLDEKILCFESNIRRSYFHVKPLETAQLENWHKYLDFAEEQKDFDWVVKLYERCLIPAANYAEVWMRYVVYMEGKGGREIANFALDRATKIFLKDMPMIHLYSARFKEASGDIMAARAALLQLKTESDENFIDNVIIKASMEKRLGNLAAASGIYREAIDRAILKNELNLLPTLYVHYSQHLNATTNCAVAARDILIEGIKHMPGSKLLYEELIKFAMTHGGGEHIDVVGSVVADALSTIRGELQVLGSTDLKYISNLYLKFVDLCGTIKDIRNALDQHTKIFRHCLQPANISPPAGIKTWKSLLEAKHETSASSPRSIGIPPKGPSVPENATFSPKSLSVSNNPSEKGHQASNRSSRQSMENDANSVQAPANPLTDRPSDSVLNGSHGVEDLKEFSVSNRVVSCRNIAEIGYSPMQNQASDRAESQYQNQDHSPFESRAQYRRMNHPDRAHRNLRFGSHGHLRKRMHYHQQLNPLQPQYPLMEKGQASFPPQNQQSQPGNIGNQFQACPTLNYNYAPGYQVPAGNGIYSQVQFPNYTSLQGSEQSGGDLQSNQAHYNQMWQYYNYYQQQQIFIQQQMQQLQLTQAQLEQEQPSPECQNVSQQLNQLQQQQQHLYQLQQLLYQQMMQQQQPLHNKQPLQQQQQPPLVQEQPLAQQQSHQALQIPQQDLLFYTQQRQLSELLQSFQQQRLAQSNELQVQQDQGLERQQQQQQIIEEEGLEKEQEVKEVQQPECIP